MSIKRQAISGTLWTAVASAVQAVIQILRLSILTRFLEKSDFGLVAIVVLILGFTQIFTDLGISVSLFSRHDISKNEYSSLYWVSLLLGGCLYGIVCIFTPFIADFYNQPELYALIPVMSLDLIFTTAGRQFRIFRQKAMKFKSLAIIDVTTTLLSLIVSVIVAYRGGGAWSIVYSTLFASFTSSCLLILSGLKSHPLSFYINFREGRSFYRTGLFQTGSQILDYVASQLDILIIGKVMGTAELGVYNLVKQLVMRIYGLLNPIITRVSIPILATLNEDLSLLKEKFLQMLKLTSLINFAIYGLMAVSAKEILTIIYGKSFEESYLVLQIFCLWGGIISVMSSASGLIVATGRTELGFRWTMLRVVANPVFIAIGYQYGFIGIVIAQAAYVVIFYNLYWRIVIQRILNPLKYGEYFTVMAYPLAYSVVIFSLLTYVRISLGHIAGNIWSNLAIFSFSYLIGYALFNKNILSILANEYLFGRSNRANNSPIN
ncbi:MOP flippase family protein [Dyadobacter bucti]|uniref:MOP flippase family protein n=1 Tax=Dyadobacter bucti TaxID=2572203 RepID=UPI003F70ED7C